MNDIATSNSLTDLARIRAEHEAAVTHLKQSLSRAIHAGGLLREARAQLAHGEWLPWLCQHCQIPERTAQIYMRLSRHAPELRTKSENSADLTIDDALKALAKPKATEVQKPPTKDTPTTVAATDRAEARARKGAWLAVVEPAQLEEQVRALVDMIDRLSTRGVMTPAMLSMSARQKLEKFERAYQRGLDAEFEARVQTECQRRISETILPHYAATHAHHEAVVKARKGVMTKATFDSIRRCLHPDSRKSVSDEKLNEAFLAFGDLEKILLDEKESPTPSYSMPRTYDEWMALKEKVKAEHKAARDAKRNAGAQAVQQRGVSP